MIHKQHLKELTQLIAVKIPQPLQGQQTKNKKSKKLQIQLKKTKASVKKIPPLSSSKNISKISVKQPERTDYFYSIYIKPK